MVSRRHHYTAAIQVDKCIRAARPSAHHGWCSNLCRLPLAAVLLQAGGPKSEQDTESADDEHGHCQHREPRRRRVRRPRARGTACRRCRSTRRPRILDARASGAGEHLRPSLQRTPAWHRRTQETTLAPRSHSTQVTSIFCICICICISKARCLVVVCARES
jgi:hypothetical protein